MRSCQKFCSLGWCGCQAVTTRYDSTSVSHEPIFRLENYAALGALKLYWDVVVYGGGKVELHTFIPYILESNPHPFYSFRGLKNQMRIRIACGLDSRS